MTQGVTIRAAEMPRELPVIQILCQQYLDHLLGLGGDVKIAVETLYAPENWATLMQELPKKHARPKGSILLADLDGDAVGCGMIQPLNDQDAEIKRVFVQSKTRGTGAGEKLSRALVAQARADGYSRILLDTTKVSTPACRLYEKVGFAERGPYADMPDFVVPLMAFYELKL